MEAERSLNLPSASRWPRKATGSNSVQPQMPKNQRIQWWRSQYEEGGKRWDEMSQLSSEARKRQDSSFLCLSSCFTQALSWLDGAYPHWGGWSTLLNQPVQRINSSRRTLLRHTQKQCLIWVLLSQSNWHIKVTTIPIMSLFFHFIPSQVWHSDINFF